MCCMTGSCFGEAVEAGSVSYIVLGHKGCEGTRLCWGEDGKRSIKSGSSSVRMSGYNRTKRKEKRSSYQL